MLNIARLHSWFNLNKRKLPWRENEHQDPYAIWVSEVMLQQTQAATVVPYFLRWMSRFPTLESLAEASLEEVIKNWEGLGYYSRARSLHEGAKYILSHFNGKMPSKKEELSLIKGIGPYTLGAILSFAFHQKIAAVDGNVMRVLTRFYKIEEDVSKPSTLKNLQLLAESILTDEAPWVTNEALIELGATVCMKKAKCEICPLKDSCLAYRDQKVELLPFKSKKTRITHLSRAVGVIASDDYFLVQKGEPGKVMSDLYQFPFLECDQSECSVEASLQNLSEHLELPLEFVRTLPEVSHSFTRYKVRLFPALFYTKERVSVKNYEWKSLERLQKCAFSSGHRQILKYFAPPRSTPRTHLKRVLVD